MTISNNNLQSLLSLNPEMSPEAAAGIQTMAISAEAETQSGLADDGEFWSMLNQQLTEITAQNDTQVIENKELLAIFNEFEIALESAGDGQEPGAAWLQIIRAQGLDETSPQAAIPAAAAVDESSLDPTEPPPQLLDSGEEALAMPLMTVITPPTAETVSVVANGNNLPRMRQPVAAGLPPVAATDAVGAAPEQLKPQATPEQLQAQDADADMLKRMLSAGDPSAETRPTLEPQLKTVESAIEKNLFKQATTEPQLLAQYRESASMPVTPLQATATSPAQSLSSSQLPTPLQTLQLSPQSAPTEWGNALGERVSFLINQKLERAEIRIDPPHLGKLDIQIQLKDDSALVTINTQQANTRDLIDSASYRLREFLQEAGYNSVDVNVSHQQQSMAEQGSDGQGQSPITGDSEADELAANGSGSDDQSVEMIMSMDQGRIDYFA